MTLLIGEDFFNLNCKETWITKYILIFYQPVYSKVTTALLPHAAGNVNIASRICVWKYLWLQSSSSICCCTGKEPIRSCTAADGSLCWTASLLIHTSPLTGAANSVLQSRGRMELRARDRTLHCIERYLLNRDLLTSLRSLDWIRVIRCAINYSKVWRQRSGLFTYRLPCTSCVLPYRMPSSPVIRVEVRMDVLYWYFIEFEENGTPFEGKRLCWCEGFFYLYSVVTSPMYTR